jgi:thioesterase domain-containing protein
MVAAMELDQPVYAFRLPEVDEARHFLTVEQLATIYLCDIRKIQKRGPYRLSGYSFGGLVAYEIATKLGRERESVGLLALFDTVHPHFSANLSTVDFVRFRVKYFADRIGKYSTNILRGRVKVLRADIARFIATRLRQVGWLVTRVLARELSRPIPTVLRSRGFACTAAWKQYNPGTYAKKLVLFRGEHRRSEHDSDITLGWAVCANGGIDVQIIPGEHETIFKPPHVYVLVEKLAPYLDC